MPIVCVNRPDRAERRPFRLRDVERIAGYVVADGLDPWVVALYAAQGAGVARDLCSVKDLLLALITLIGFFRTVAQLLGAVKGTRILLRILAIILRVTPIRLKPIVLLIITLLSIITRERQAIETVAEELGTLIRIARNMQVACAVLFPAPLTLVPPERPLPVQVPTIR